jgi:hypothetical protein
VAKPESNHGLVDAMLQELHRCGVAQNVGADALAGERWAGGSGGSAVLAYEMLDRIAAQPVSPDRREERIVFGAATFLEPAFGSASV